MCTYFCLSIGSFQFSWGFKHFCPPKILKKKIGINCALIICWPSINDALITCLPRVAGVGVDDCPKIFMLQASSPCRITRASHNLHQIKEGRNNLLWQETKEQNGVYRQRT